MTDCDKLIERKGLRKDMNKKKKNEERRTRKKERQGRENFS